MVMLIYRLMEGINHLQQNNHLLQVCFKEKKRTSSSRYTLSAYCTLIFNHGRLQCEKAFHTYCIQQDINISINSIVYNISCTVPKIFQISKSIGKNSLEGNFPCISRKRASFPWIAGKFPFQETLYFSKSVLFLAVPKYVYTVSKVIRYSSNSGLSTVWRWTITSGWRPR
jgi:hypothetical protein